MVELREETGVQRSLIKGKRGREREADNRKKKNAKKKQNRNKNKKMVKKTKIGRERIIRS